MRNCLLVVLLLIEQVAQVIAGFAGNVGVRARLFQVGEQAHSLAVLLARLLLGLGTAGGILAQERTGQIELGHGRPRIGLKSLAVFYLGIVVALCLVKAVAGTHMVAFLFHSYRLLGLSNNRARQEQQHEQWPKPYFKLVFHVSVLL